MVTSMRITEDAIEFSNEGKLVGKLYKRQIDPKNLNEFMKANYTLQGTVKYDAWIAGAFAGLALLLGEHMIGPGDREEISPTDPIEHSVVELTGDGTGEAAVPLVEQILSGELTAAAPELLPGEIVVPGHTVIDFKPVEAIPAATAEAITAAPESPAAVGESIPAVSDSPAAVVNPEASGAASP